MFVFEYLKDNGSLGYTQFYGGDKYKVFRMKGATWRSMARLQGYLIL
jgi:hypothetical protein